jgi:hypothetical protein
MGFALFMIFCSSVALFGFGFVILTVRHHMRLAKLAKGEKNASKH